MVLFHSIIGSTVEPIRKPYATGGAMIYRQYTVAACAFVLLLALFAVPPAHAQDGPLYFPSTGHHLTDEQGFLSFWRAQNGEQLLGYPITEVIEVNGVAQQYFERGRLEQQATADGGTRVTTGQVGAEYAAALWKRFAPAPPHMANADEQVFTNGHTLRAPFLSFWRAAGGLEFFGPPLSEMSWEMTTSGRRLVQYFERARLERDAQTGVVVGDLGRALAALRGIDTTPVANVGYESYGPDAPAQPDVGQLHPPAPPPQPAAAPAPAATKPPAAPAAPPRSHSPGGAKLIVVNLSDQWMYAFEGGEQVFDAPVSTGRDGMETPTGTFAIYSKLPVQTMDGVTNGEYWVVPNVPNVMYIHGGVALHGTYWHNRFGTGARLSHGCVNLPLKAAAWLYNWAPMGTPVQVTY